MKYHSRGCGVADVKVTMQAPLLPNPLLVIGGCHTQSNGAHESEIIFPLILPQHTKKAYDKIMSNIGSMTPKDPTQKQ